MTKKIDDVLSCRVTWTQVHHDTCDLVRKLSILGSWKGVVALTRGGMIPAAIVAREMDIRIIDTLCISAYEDRTLGAAKVLKEPAQAIAEQGAGWVLVDDLVDTGTTLKVARKILPKAHFATVYAKPDGVDIVDSYVRVIEQATWVLFPWDTDPQSAAS
jgi:xanthine phosphoribosyltransferase